MNRSDKENIAAGRSELHNGFSSSTRANRVLSTMAGLGTGAGAPVVKVYHERSMILPDVSRVLACLYEKNVQFETVTDSYKDILRLQATRSVPVPFYDGPTFRQESRAICRYIAETYEHRGYPFLLGKDVLERASIEQWLRHEEHAFDPPSRALFCHLAFPLHDEDMSDIDREKRKLEEVLEVYEQRLGESEFLAGNKFTLADLVHLPNTHHIQKSEFAYLYDSRKNVQRWWNTISARDSWQQVVKDMQSVEEQNQKEELEQQEMEEQWQWETEPTPTSGRRILRIDPRQQTGPESRTVLVPPPSGGAISSSFFTVQQEQQPLPAETTSHGETSRNKRKESNFFTTTEKTPALSKQRTPTTQKPPSSVQSTTSNFFTPATPPTTNKMSPKTDTDKASSKDASSPTKTSQRSSKEIPDELHRSDFYKARSYPDEVATHTKPTPQEASKTSDRVFQDRRTGEAVAPTKSNPGSVPSSVQSTTSNFFTPPTTKPQRANTEKSTSKDASSPTRPGQGSSKEAPDKLHLSDFYKASGHTDETSIPTKPTPKEASKSSDRFSAPRQTSEVVPPGYPSPASPKTPSGIDRPDYETEKKPTSVNPWVDSPVPYTKPDDSQTPRSPSTRPALQRPADTSGPGAGEIPSNQRSVVQTPYAQQLSEEAKKATADQRATAQTAPQVRYRDAKDSTKEAREADQKRAASATTRELPSGSQNIPQQSKAPPTNLKASDLSPMEEEYEDIQGEDGRFSTKRLRKMLEQSDPEALKSQPTALQTHAIQEETPSIDKKEQAGNSSANGRTDGTPSTGKRDPSTPTAVDTRRVTSPPKGGMDSDGRGVSATEPRKLPSINEKEPAPPMPSQLPTSSARRASASSNGAAQDDDLAQSNIDQWRYTSTPAIQQGATRDRPSDKAPPSPSFADRRNVKTGIDEASQTATVAPDDQPGGTAPTNSVNKSISSKDNGKQTNETVYYRSSEKSREMAPSVSEKSMGQQKVQGSDAALLINADQNSGKAPGQALQDSLKQTTPDTEQVKNNRSNSTSDSSSKPTREFDGNEDDARETQKGG